jgi:cyclophilin family peptidyl-prolyl cis-trans isomerase
LGTTVDFTTNFGDIVIDLDNADAPLTVANFLAYAENMTVGQGYEDSFFHRLATGFVLQGGGYDYTSAGASAIAILGTVENEYSPDHPNVEGTIAMAKVGSDPNSATDQFFFNLADNSANLDAQDGGFTVFGTVTAASWPVVEAIASLPVVDAGSPFDDLPVQGTLTNSAVTAANLVFITDVTVTPPCFAASTRIATSRGEVSVEALRVGDEVSTQLGGPARINWLGHRRIDCHRHIKPQSVWPVRIRVGAFAPGQPARDLFLSPEHAVFVDGILIPIRHLINGRTILQEAREKISYWHVELERHDVICAEGLPCETYLDTGNRSVFANAERVVQLFPDFALDSACELIWEASGCAPLRIEGPEVARVVARLGRRATRLGYAAAGRGKRRPPPDTANTQTADPAPAHALQPNWYHATYPDVAASGLDPARHYAGWGRHEGRLPCPAENLIRALGLVDRLTLAITMPDVVAAGIDPVAHFCRQGWCERRRPNLYFDTGWYLDTHELPPDTNPLLHYVLVGEAAGLRPGRHFDPAWYRQRYAVAENELALAHFLARRRLHPTSPHAAFDADAYARCQVAELLAGRDLYAHFVATCAAQPSTSSNERSTQSNVETVSNLGIMPRAGRYDRPAPRRGGDLVQVYRSSPRIEP